MDVFLIVFGCLAVVATVLIICACASNSSAPFMIEVDNHGNFRKSCSSEKCTSTTCSSTNKKTFPSMKKGSKFIIGGRVAEKISDTMYQYTDTLEQAYWLARDLYYYQMIFEPAHPYEAVDSGGNSTPETTYVAPVIVPIPTPVVSHPLAHSNPDPYLETPPAPVSSSHSEYSSPSHSSDHSNSHSSHSSCSSSSSSHSSCSSSSSSCSNSSSSCSSSSCGGSSCGGGY